MDFKESLQEIKGRILDKNIATKKSSIDILDLKTTDYNSSELEALKKGFEEIQDMKAYNGRYFVKNGLIWIHDIKALKAKLNIHDEDELRGRKYDVDTYYNRKSKIASIRKKATKEMRIYDEKSNMGIDYGRENMVYMNDGVYIHKNDCWW